MTKNRCSYIGLICWILIGVGCKPEATDTTQHNGPAFDASKSDAKAVAVVDAMQKALGMPEHWQQARYFSYHWIVSRDGKELANRRHDWDRFTGRYRLEYRNRDGQHVVALFKTQTKSGDVFVDGEPVTVDSTKNKLLENAYGAYINDSYWLLMPYKLKEPGVRLSYDGEEKDPDGTTFDVVKVTFDSVGLTPGDTYWAYVDRTDHLMKKWRYFLQGWPEDRDRGSAYWQDWRDFNGIKLALNKPFEKGGVKIYFTDVKVSAQPDDKTLTSAAKTF